MFEIFVVVGIVDVEFVELMDRDSVFFVIFDDE